MASALKAKMKWLFKNLINYLSPLQKLIKLFLESKSKLMVCKRNSLVLEISTGTIVLYACRLKKIILQPDQDAVLCLPS